MTHFAFSALSIPHLVRADDHEQTPAAWNPQEPGAILPGSFNPVHDGHWQLAEVAREILGRPVAFELSLANVDKAPLDERDLHQRLQSFRGRADIWLTRAARFIDKAELFPGAIFVVGADTAQRILEPKYYEGRNGLGRALACLRAWECRFLVACRIDDRGECREWMNRETPPEFADLFQTIPATRFRLDISSTEIRTRRANEAAPRADSG